MRFNNLGRRDFIALLGGATVAWPLAVGAQQPERVRRIGVLANEDWPPLDGFRTGLRGSGYIEGQNLQVEYRFAQGRADRYSILATELVQLGVEVIVTSGTPATDAAKLATTTIPIVMHSGDPIDAGIVSNLARPGGNVTGISTLAGEPESKRIELVKELIPNLSRVTMLSNPTNPYSDIAVKYARLGATALGLQLDVADISTERDIDKVLPTLSHARTEAVLVIGDPLLVSRRTQIAEFMVRNRLPSIYSFRDHVLSGGLISYSTSYHDVFRRMAGFVDKILKGANSGELPIEQPTKFELVVNLKTAKAIGLTIPESFLVRADEVIE
jgi:putative ABC transport system substrate-binding protein